MTCSKCGANNIDGSNFCIKCGANLKEMPQTIQTNNAPSQNLQQMNVQQEQPINSQQLENTQQPTYNQPIQQSNANTSASTSPLNYLMYIIAVMIKPFKSFKEEETKLNDTKTSLILALIMSGAMTIINLIKTIFSTVRVASYSWTSGYTYSWQWDNLKNIKWIEVIGKNFLIYACVLLAIALIFYLGSLIIKKQLSFIKSLSIASTSVIPAIICGMIISPLAGKIWSPLSIVFIAIGGVYSFIILYELMNEELKLDGDKKIYFNLISLGILTIAGYYAFMKLFMSSLTSELGGLLNLFK